MVIIRRLSDFGIIYCGKAEFGHISRSFSLNSWLFASNDRKICLKSDLPSLRLPKSDSLLDEFIGTVSRTFLLAGAVFGFLAVMLGAFGAHALRDRLTESLLAAFQTGVQYQFYHALGLMLVGMLVHLYPDNTVLKWGGYLFIAGVLLFSGSLYLLAITELRFFGPITPLGGIAFIGGWLALIVAFARQ